MTRISAASAPGKIILSGEHFVVHGSYSVAAAIDRRVFVTVREIEEKSRIVSEGQVSNISVDDGRFRAVKLVSRNILSSFPKSEKNRLEVSIRSEIPAGSGLGSSAAVSVATAAALSDFLGLALDKKQISVLAFQGEKAVHGNPSGLDNQVCLLGGLIVFNRELDTETVELKTPFRLLVVFSGRKRKTSKLIEKVAHKRQQFPNYFLRLLESTSNISLSVAQAAKKGDIETIGYLFTALQAQLSWIGVSTPQLDSLIEFVCKSENVLGTKITGAGGGGSIIAALRRGAEESVLKGISNSYPFSFVTQIPQEGLRWEKSKI